MVVIWPFLLALITFLLIKIALSYPGVVEQVYSTGLYPNFARILSTLSNLLPFSVWDIFWVILTLSLLLGLVFVFIRKLKFSRYILKILQFAALLYAFFYLVWGFNYFRPRIETRLSWSKPKADEAEFRTILDSFIVHTNTSYTPIQPSDYQEIDRLVEESYSRNSSALGLNYPNGSRRPKTMIFSSFFAKSGVSGYFGPFFNEIHLNYYLLPMEYPYVLAHEKAHQFGISNEAEANFAAFVICTT